MSELQYIPEILDFEEYMLELPQAECSVVHKFLPGKYIRELHMKAGTIAIGHAQKQRHLNRLIQGSVSMFMPDGSTKIVKAPLEFIGEPGKKMGTVLEDCIWQNVYDTDETDIQKLEEMFLEKSTVFNAHAETKRLQCSMKSEDQLDYEAVLEQYGFNEELVQKQVQNTEDQIGMPFGEWKFKIGKSNIHGDGVICTADIKAFEHIGPGRMSNMRTPLGRFTNHAKDANSAFILLDNGDIAMIAMRDIQGCRGGQDGEEITVNYRQALSLAQAFEQKELQCQE